MKLLKQPLIYGLFLVALLIPSFSAGEYSFYTINHSCQHGHCVEGDSMTWEIIIHNRGFEKMEIIGIELRDYTDDSLLAKYNVSILGPQRGPSFFPNQDHPNIIII